MEGFPKCFGAPGAGRGPFFSARKSPTFFDAVTAFDIFATVFVEAADVRLEPGIEDRDAVFLQKLADAIAPALLLFVRTRRHKIHWSGQVNPGTFQQSIFTIWPKHGGG